MRTFGPVPSRRLGRSLGINNIPAKTCSYSCVYCQLGAGFGLETTRRAFFDYQEIVDSVKQKLQLAKENNEPIDYATFVPDGEPTLDINLGTTIKALRPLDPALKIAVITNSSLMWDPEVRKDLANADLVSIKVDTVDESTWRRLDRPHRSLKLDAILNGIKEFASSFKGEIITETMLVNGLNDSEKHIEETAAFLASINPSVAYLAIPTRPPAEKWAGAPSETVINRAYVIMSEHLKNVEYLIGYEGDAFSHTGNVGEDILNITSVHPMRRSAVEEFLSEANESWDTVQKLIDQEKLLEVEYRKHKYYLRNLHNH